MACPLAHTKLNRGKPRKGDHSDSKGGQHHPHGNIWYCFRVDFAAFELERAIVARQQASETNQHLPKRRMHIEVELALEIMRAKLAKVGLIPNNDIRRANFVKPRPAREKGVDNGWNFVEVL